MYKEVKSLEYKKSRRNISTITDENRNVIQGSEGVMARWKQYVEGLYSTENRPENLNLEEIKDVAEVNEGPPIIRAEFDKALSEMHNGKAVGVDEIPAELIKNLGEEAKKEIFRLCSDIYNSGIWPEDVL